MRRGRLRGTTALVEPDADPFSLAPGYVARPFQLLRGHKKREAVGDGQRDHDFERGSGLREIPYRAVDCPAAELNGSGLQYAVPRGDPGLIHLVIIGRFTAGCCVQHASILAMARLAYRVRIRVACHAIGRPRGAPGTLFSSGELRGNQAPGPCRGSQPRRLPNPHSSLAALLFRQNAQDHPRNGKKQKQQGAHEEPCAF